MTDAQDEIQAKDKTIATLQEKFAAMTVAAKASGDLDPDDSATTTQFSTRTSSTKPEEEADLIKQIGDMQASYEHQLAVAALAVSTAQNASDQSKVKILELEQELTIEKGRITPAVHIEYDSDFIVWGREMDVLFDKVDSLLPQIETRWLRKDQSCEVHMQTLETSVPVIIEAVQDMANELSQLTQEGESVHEITRESKQDANESNPAPKSRQIAPLSKEQSDDFDRAAFMVEYQEASIAFKSESSDEEHESSQSAAATLKGAFEAAGTFVENGVDAANTLVEKGVDAVTKIGALQVMSGSAKGRIGDIIEGELHVAAGNGKK